MRLVITGGAGFIGANLARHLLEGGTAADVVVVDDLSTGVAANLDGLDVRHHVGSILDAGLLDRAFAGADAVVHLAARASVPRSLVEPVAAHAVNATGTVEVLEAARRAGGPHLVLASSSSVYGANPELPQHEGLAPRPVSPYAASKLAGEAYALAWADAYGLDVLALRLFNVYGPRQRPRQGYANVVPAFMEALFDGRPLPVHGDGLQTRDFTYVDSVCALIADAVGRRVASTTPVNLAFGSRLSVIDLVGALERVTGRSLAIEYQPSRPGDVPATHADTTQLRSLFPDAQPVPLHDGMMATAEWFAADRDRERERPSGRLAQG